MSKWNNASKTSFSNSTKKVEFSGTEIHFSPNSQRISIRLGEEEANPPFVINSSNGSTNFKDQEFRQPKRGILKNKILKPNKYYLGEHQHTINNGEQKDHSKIRFDLPKTELDRDNQHSPKANLTSFKLIMDIIGSDKNNSSKTTEEDDRKFNFPVNKSIDKIRPIAKPRKIFSTSNSVPKMNFTSHSLNNNHQGTSKTTEHKFKLYERNYDLARDEKVLNELINAADELIKSST